jgi:O-antigen ligase
LKQDRLLVGVEWGLLLAGLAGLSIFTTFGPAAAIGLGLLAAGWLIRAYRSRQFLPRTGLEMPWGLFLFSAGMGALVSYNPSEAWLQFARILAAAVFYYAIAGAGETSVAKAIPQLAAVGLAAAGAGLGLYFPLHNNFMVEPIKFGPINALGLQINRIIPPLPGPYLHFNVVAGFLAICLPFAFLFAWKGLPFETLPARIKIPARVGGAIAIAAMLFGLAMTASRGAALGLAATAGMGAVILVQNRLRHSVRARQVTWSALILLAVIVSAALLLASRNRASTELVGQIPDPTGSLQGRLYAWQQGISLIRDYPITGSGLASFKLAYPVYSLLIQDAYLQHIHNTYLEVWIEQGIIGIFALLWGLAIISIWAWRAVAGGSQIASGLGWAALAGLSAAAIHGLLDVVFYIERGLPILGILSGIAWYYLGRADPMATRKPVRAAAGWTAVAIALSGLILGGIFFRPLAGLAYANLGAVRQSRYELASFQADWTGKAPTLDELRRSPGIEPAIAAYQAALTWDPTNQTARQRLAEIALSRGDYPAAEIHATAAWQADQGNNQNRLLRGDALAANGDPQSAAQTVKGLAWAPTRLMAQAWYRYWLAGDYRRALSAWQTALILEPDNAEAQNWQKLAQEKLSNSP